MMARDLKKMVEEWRSTHYGAPFPFQDLLAAMAAEIEANREEIEALKEGEPVNPYLLDEERNAELREALKELASLMQGVIDGMYKPDSFTLQPTEAALAKAEPKSGEKENGN